MATQKKPRASGTTAKAQAKTPAPRSTAPRDKVQGEGDYASAREFNEDERRFVASHDTEELARRAKPEDAAKAAELEQAERKGKSHARPDPETEADHEIDGTESRPADDADEDLERGRS